MSTLSGGNKLAAYLQGVVNRIKPAGTLRVGFLENATYPDGTPVAAIAAKNEYGAKDTPMRPYFRQMIKENKGNWPSMVGKLAVLHKYDMRIVWQLMGEEIRGELQDSIQGWITPANSPQTIARKGFNKPLIDTGHMLNSADYDYGAKP